MNPQCATCRNEILFLDKLIEITESQEQFNKLYYIVQNEARKNCTFYISKFNGQTILR